LKVVSFKDYFFNTARGPKLPCVAGLISLFEGFKYKVDVTGITPHLLKQLFEPFCISLLLTLEMSRNNVVKSKTMGCLLEESSLVRTTPG